MERNLTEVGHVCVLIIREMGAGGAEESFKNISIDPIVIIVVIVIKLNLLSNTSQFPWSLNETLALLINIRHSPVNIILFLF